MMVPVKHRRRERRLPVLTLDVDAFEKLANNMDYLICATLPGFKASSICITV
jgi:hypothetical protein